LQESSTVSKVELIACPYWLDTKISSCKSKMLPVNLIKVMLITIWRSH